MPTPHCSGLFQARNAVGRFLRGPDRYGEERKTMSVATIDTDRLTVRAGERGAYADPHGNGHAAGTTDIVAGTTDTAAGATVPERIAYGRPFLAPEGAVGQVLSVSGGLVLSCR